MIGTGEIVVILALGTLLFGGKKIPEFAKNIGRGMREFKRALHPEIDPEIGSDLHDPHDKK